MLLKFKKLHKLLKLKSRWPRKNLSSAAAEGKVLVKRLVADYEGITVLGLNQCETKNAFSLDMAYCFKKLLREIECDNETRVLIVRSLVPKAFCVGIEKTKDPQLLAECKELLLNIEQLPLPVIAAIDGDALDYGLQLALACDLRIATCEAKFRASPQGAQRLAKLLPPAKAKELIFTAQEFTGEEAFDMGLVNYAVEQNDAKNAAYLKAKALAKEMLPNEADDLCRAKLSINQRIYNDAHQVSYHQEQVILEKQHSIRSLKADEGGQQIKNAPRWRRSMLIILLVILFLWVQALVVIALVVESVLWNAMYMQNWYDKGVTYWKKLKDDD